MSTLAFPWLLAAMAAPWLAVLATLAPFPPRRLRVLAVAAGAASLACGVAAAWQVEAGGGALLVDPWDPGRALLGEPALAVDGLNAWLVPFAALIGAAWQLALPNAQVTPGQVRRAMAALALMVGSFATTSGPVLAVLFAAGVVPLWLEWGARSEARTRRLLTLYMGVAVAALGAGVLLVRRGGAGVPWGTGLILLAVLVRKGIFPLHSWMPASFERAPLSAATLFTAPQVGAYVALRLLEPVASDGALVVLGELALFTAMYGAALALFQSEGRRAFGFMFMSQSALVVVGLDCTSAAGLAGGLVWWLASGLALTGHGICLALLEARRGHSSIRTWQGGYEGMPGLAISFLVLGLSSVGFPGTMGFVGAELLVAGATEHFPHAGFAVLLVAGLNAITVVRMYFALFCGRKIALPAHQRLRPHEYAAVTLLLAVVFAGGIAPRWLVARQDENAAAVLTARAQHHSH